MTTPCGLFDARAYKIFDWVAPALIRDRGVKSIIDIGAGRTWHFGAPIKAECGFKLIGVDDDGDELALNPQLDERVVADASKNLGVADGSVDLVLSRATIEHVPDNAGLIAATFRALRPGGRYALVFTNRWAPPALLNQMMPNWLARRLLYALVPGSRGYQGFVTHYDLCLHSEYKQALIKQGFNVEYEYNSYYASSYWQFFLPLHMLSIAFDFLRMLTGSRNLSSQCVFVAVKPEA